MPFLQVATRSCTRFFVAARGEVDEEGLRELAVARDVVLLQAEQTYRTISAATLAVFQHVVSNYEFAFVLKVSFPCMHVSPPPKLCACVQAVLRMGHLALPGIGSAEYFAGRMPGWHRLAFMPSRLLSPLCACARLL